MRIEMGSRWNDYSMRSIKLHLSEKILSINLFLFGLSFILTSIVPEFNKLQKFQHWVDFSLVVLFCITFILTIFTFFFFRKWKKDGFTLSKQIGLKNLVIFQTYLETTKGEVIFELHHRPNTVKGGLKLKRYPKKAIIKALKSDLTNDFEKLASFCNEVNARLITVTHLKMAHIWKESSKDYFEVEMTKAIEDPFVKPKWLQWQMLSISTTGRMAKVPKEWEAYVFSLLDRSD